MALSTRTARWFAAILSVSCLLSAADGQQPPFKMPANPQSPTIGVPQPLGAHPGGTTEITLTGANLNDPVGLLLGFPAKVTFPTDGDNTKNSAKLRVKVEVPPGTPIGLYPLRLVTKQGVSNFRPFCIDDLPAAPAGGSNRSASTALSIPVPSVATGRIDPETSEFFKIAVKPGQRVAIDALARRIGRRWTRSS